MFWAPLGGTPPAWHPPRRAAWFGISGCVQDPNIQTCVFFGIRAPFTLLHEECAHCTLAGS